MMESFLSLIPSFIIDLNDFQADPDQSSIDYPQDDLVTYTIVKGRSNPSRKYILKSIKIIPETQKQFIREIITMSTVSHRFLEKIEGYSFIDQNGSPGFYLLYHYYEKSLYSFINAEFQNQTPILTPTEKTIIAYSLMVGLEYLHDLGICHRALNPHLIRITPEKEARISYLTLSRYLDPVKLGDRNQQKDPLLQSVSKPHAFDPTQSNYDTKFEWLSPEQMDCQEIDHSSDIFTYGQIIYFMLTGKELPRNQFESPNQYFPPETPHGLINMIRASMKMRSEERPTATDIVQAFVSHEAFFFGTNQYQFDEFVKKTNQMIFGTFSSRIATPQFKESAKTIFEESTTIVHPTSKLLYSAVEVRTQIEEYSKLRLTVYYGSNSYNYYLPPFFLIGALKHYFETFTGIPASLFVVQQDETELSDKIEISTLNTKVVTIHEIFTNINAKFNTSECSQVRINIPSLNSKYYLINNNSSVNIIKHDIMYNLGIPYEMIELRSGGQKLDDNQQIGQIKEIELFGLENEEFDLHVSVHGMIRTIKVRPLEKILVIRDRLHINTNSQITISSGNLHFKESKAFIFYSITNEDTLTIEDVLADC